MTQLRVLDHRRQRCNSNSSNGTPKDSSNPIGTLTLLGDLALWEAANFHRNLKRDDFGKVHCMAADIMTIDGVADHVRIKKKTA